LTLWRNVNQVPLSATWLLAINENRTHVATIRDVRYHSACFEQLNLQNYCTSSQDSKNKPTIFVIFTGTILAGVSVLFCGTIRQSGEEKVGVFCTNLWVGIFQALLAPFFIGWIWSVIWGIAIISASG